jgi:hypothetical protein
MPAARLNRKKSPPMASIESINASRSNAISQYQDYVARLRQAKAQQESTTDKPVPAQLEAKDATNDPDRDGD